jgi:hypothetical protein
MPQVHLPLVNMVEVGTLDALAIGRVDLLKIDAEGHEPEVIAGAAVTLARTGCVLFEWLAGSGRYREPDALAAILAQLARHGFHVRDAHGADVLPSSADAAHVCIARKRRS